MDINPSDTITVTLAFTEAQLASIRLYGCRPEQSHLQHAPEELDTVYVYENKDDQMILWVFHKNGDVHVGRK